MRIHPVTAPRRSPVLVAPLAAAFAIVIAFVGAAPAHAAASATVQSNVQYEVVGNQRLLMDVYRPSGSGPFPGVVLFHPGGFVKGDKADPDVAAVARDLAAAGYETFSANYRLSPEFHYPAAVQDAQAAVTFIRANAGQFSIDPTRIGSFGGSAGATIALSLGVEGSGSLCSGSRVAAVVSWSAAIDFPKVIQERPSDAAGAVEKYAGVIGARHVPLVAQDQVPSTLENAEPLTHLDRTDPPTFVANSANELMPLDQAQEFVQRLTADGIPHEYFSQPRGHAFDYTATAIGPSIDFLNKYLRDIRCTPGASTSGTSASPAPSSGASPGGHGSHSPRPGRSPHGHAAGPASNSKFPLAPVAAAGGVAVALAVAIWAILAYRRAAPYRG